MANYLSEDLRIRVIEAVEAGSSRRGAAARFGVSVSSAIRWVDVHRALSELQALETDLSVGTGTVWRFFDRHGISFKKNRARRRAGAP